MKNPRILAMRTGGTIAPYIIDEFAKAFNRLQSQTLVLDFEEMKLYDKADEQIASNIIKKIKNFAPDFIISYAAEGLIEINNNFSFSHLAEELKIPYCLLFFDAPYKAEKILRAFAKSPLMNVFCWDKYYFPFFKECGLPTIHYLPLATNVETFHRPIRNSENNIISFVGTLNIELLNSQPPASNALLPIVNCIFQKHIQDPTKNFDELLDEATSYLSNNEKKLFHNFKMSSAFALFRQDIQRRADALYRSYAIKSLANQKSQYKLHIYGNDGWLALLQGNENVFYKGKVNYGKELAEVYNTSDINLNLTVMQVVSTVNQRVFDCPVAGGFLITDYRKDLEELFEIDEEVVCFKTIEEMIEKVRHFSYDVKKRNLIVEKASKRIIAHHTWKHRAQQILSVL